jgi:hypothetical protein
MSEAHFFFLFLLVFVVSMASVSQNLGTTAQFDCYENSTDTQVGRHTGWDRLTDLMIARHSVIQKEPDSGQGRAFGNKCILCHFYDLKT